MTSPDGSLNSALDDHAAGRLTDYDLYRHLCNRSYDDEPARHPDPLNNMGEVEAAPLSTGTRAEVGRAWVAHRIPDKVYLAWRDHEKKKTSRG